jgi:hypothetical protein
VNALRLLAWCRLPRTAVRSSSALSAQVIRTACVGESGRRISMHSRSPTRSGAGLRRAGGSAGPQHDWMIRCSNDRRAEFDEVQCMEPRTAVNVGPTASIRMKRAESVVNRSFARSSSSCVMSCSRWRPYSSTIFSRRRCVLVLPTRATEELIGEELRQLQPLLERERPGVIEGPKDWRCHRLAVAEGPLNVVDRSTVRTPSTVEASARPHVLDREDEGPLFSYDVDSDLPNFRPCLELRTRHDVGVLDVGVLHGPVSQAGPTDTPRKEESAQRVLPAASASGPSKRVPRLEA